MRLKVKTVEQAIESRNELKNLLPSDEKILNFEVEQSYSCSKIR